MEGRDKAERGGWSTRERESSKRGVGAESTWQNQTGRSGGRVAEACALHESRGSLERPPDSKVKAVRNSEARA
eukprot:4336073-Pyramimonas_sp.AAC.1